MHIHGIHGTKLITIFIQRNNYYEKNRVCGTSITFSNDLYRPTEMAKKITFPFLYLFSHLHTV